METVITYLVIFILGAISFYLYFHRDPIRVIPLGSNIVSPADGIIGKVIRVNGKETEIEKGVLGRLYTTCNEISKDCILVQIIMRPWDVHVQRSPITGVVESVTYHKGKFRNAMWNAKSLRVIDNEQNEIVIKNNLMKIKVIQIAGVLARRIACFVHQDENILKGQKLGVIKLGSQVCLMLPYEKVNINTHEGKKVYAGKSIIGTYKR